ncbi:MAG: Fe(3+) ABC transporter substrate-binding protein [Hyphomicrobiales bacterium]
MKYRRLAVALASFLALAEFAASASAAEVNLYSARKEDLIKPLLDRFTEKTGIAVNLITGEADVLLQRIVAEGANTPADLLLTTDAGRLFRAKAEGVTAPIGSPALADAIPASYRDPEDHWVGLSLRARPIMYVKGKVDPATLSTYEALAGPQWQGRICIRSSSNVYNQSMLASIIAADGAGAAESWARGLVANFARPPEGGDRDQLKAAAAGQCDIAIANTYYLAGMLGSGDASQREAAAKIGVFWPNQDGRGVHVNVSGAAMIKASKNVDAARRLLEFLANDESQAWYAEVNGEYPVRAGLGRSEVLAAWGEFKADDLNLGRLGELNAEAVMIMDRAGWK